MGAQVAVVFQQASRLTSRQARAVLKGVEGVDGVRAHLVPVEELDEGSYGWTALDRADAIVFGAPTYLGSVPERFRRLRQASAKRPWGNKIAAGFTCAGSLSDGEGSGLDELARIASDHGMDWLAAPRAGGDAESAELLGRTLAERVVART